MNTEVEEQTEFKFSELSDRAKDKARDAHRYNDVSDDWWDTTYEDAVRMGALLGINISSTERKTTRGHTVTDIDISFSGFCSQGDGASFEGEYRYNPDAIAKVTAETNDEELIRIAGALTVMQLTRRLHGFEPFWAKVSRGYSCGSSCHSGTMVIDLRLEDEDDITELDKGVTILMRDFADWIYEQLEAEHDYLTSDEYIDERLNEDETLFDEDGEEII